MPSITFWNRLEPRARTTDIAASLAARIRDPAWLLARQWQLGEFRGEDAASPAYIRVAARLAPMYAWDTGASSGQPPAPLAGDAPIEHATTREPFSSSDLSIAVELGRVFDRLVPASAAALRAIYRVAFPIAASDGGDDPQSARLRTLWTGRASHGIAIYHAAIAGAGIPSMVPTALRPAAETVLNALVAHVRQLYGDVGAADPPAWRPERLDYSLRVHAGAQIDGSAVSTALAATPDREGDLEWFAFDATSDSAPAGVPPLPVTTAIRRAVIPGHVRFRGMPNERFWDFEDRRVDFGDVRPDRRSLATMLMVDFMLVHGSDWFIVPFEQPIGTLCRAEITVVDVFGGVTPVPRADTGQSSAAPWSMFSTARSNGTLCDFLLVPATAAATVADAAPIEEVRFMRDEGANLAWAIERATESRLGAAQLGHDRDTMPSPPASSDSATLHYKLQTPVPTHWIPLQPVAVPPASAGQIALERAALLSLDGPPIVPQPHGKILQPSALPAGTPYRIQEQELPREGVRVSRLTRSSRGSSGGAYLWRARKRSVGAGEGWSGLRFDVAANTEET